MNWADISRDVTVNLIANVIFASIVVALAVILGNLARRRKLRDFFHMRAHRGRLPVYLSNIVVKRRGTIGTGELSVGYHGTAITELEYKYALEFAATVESKPFYRALRAIDSAVLLTPADPIVCHIGTSPSSKQFGDGSGIGQYIHEGATLIVGAPVYNALTDFLMRVIPSRFEFVRREDGERGIRVRNYRGSDSRTYYRERFDGEQSDGQTRPYLKEWFVLERLVWGRGQGNYRRESTIFICAGTCSAATAAALRMLRDWPALAREYGPGNFGLLCEIQLDGREEDETREFPPPDEEPSIVFRYGERH
ncbi:hypothetical protein [Nonomuraea fuscirosea]|uniref:hypothetical protein n=1 Tax=Nonomuraea fuscirosea TaxID=1291556 RepID=UPI0033FDDC33